MLYRERLFALFDTRKTRVRSDFLGRETCVLYKSRPIHFRLCKGRVRNPKNQLLQIEPPTIVGCSLWYPIARSTMKPEARLSSSQKYQF